MLCPRCGKDIELSPNSRFCPGCGLEFVWKPKYSANTTPPPPVSGNENDDPNVVLRKIGDAMDRRKEINKKDDEFISKAIKVIAGIIFWTFAILILISLLLCL